MAAYVVTMFGIAAHDATATTVTVGNCDDNGTGSLRQIVSSVAQSGDVIDMSELTPSSPGCTASTISLHTGAITIPQNALTLIGPGPNHLAISGKYQNMREKDRVLNHTGGGDLLILGLAIRDGDYYSSSPSQKIVGGCIKSAGTVLLGNSTVSYCLLEATGTGSVAYGAGVAATNGVYLANTGVYGNTASSSAGRSAGGGVYSKGKLTVHYSSIADNSASLAGGVIAIASTSGGSVTISNSTISGNHATTDVGGLEISSFPSATPVAIIDSTIADNSAENYIGGLLVNRASLTIQNSTIAFNTAAFNNATDLGAGLFIQEPDATYTVKIQSSIFSNNIVQDVPDDLEILPQIGSAATMPVGANNLVYATQTSLPANFGLAQGICPLLGPLANNGGSTQTLALLSGSPAIAQGNDTADLNTDQRGSGFSRTRIGIGGIKFTDIGAYEVQSGDIIFNAGFNGCP